MIPDWMRDIVQDAKLRLGAGYLDDYKSTTTIGVGSVGGQGPLTAMDPRVLQAQAQNAAGLPSTNHYPGYNAPGGMFQPVQAWPAQGKVAGRPLGQYGVNSMDYTITEVKNGYILSIRGGATSMMDDVWVGATMEEINKYVTAAMVQRKLAANAGPDFSNQAKTTRQA